MTQQAAISLVDVSKVFELFDRPEDRLKQFLVGNRRRYGRRFHALDAVSVEIMPGEVIGIVGKNGAGKSTLLQLVCGTLQASSGQVAVRGRVAALLELGSGFNPEFSGRENVFLNAAILGLSHSEITARFDEIVAFADIGEFIEQPVKTYSSGMYMRLAFSVAINVDPDILIIDEALSVGDGLFARKSFDRIMQLKGAGKTILFCSHSMYHVEALCTRAIWLEQGKVMRIGPAPRVCNEYGIHMAAGSTAPTPVVADKPADNGTAAQTRHTASLTDVKVTVDGRPGRHLVVCSGESDVTISVSFNSDPALPCPGIAVGFVDQRGAPVASAGSHNDGIVLQRDANGAGNGTLTFPRFPLLKGDYTVSIFLICERAIHIYDFVEQHTRLEVTQHSLEQGIVSLPHQWQTTTA